MPEIGTLEILATKRHSPEVVAAKVVLINHDYSLRPIVHSTAPCLSRLGRYDDAQGDHPIVRALFAAMNSGEFKGIGELIDEDCEVDANDYRPTTASFDRRPNLMVGTLETFYD